MPALRGRGITPARWTARAGGASATASAVLGSTASVVLLLALNYARPIDRSLAPVDWLVFGAGLLVVTGLIA